MKKKELNVLVSSHKTSSINIILDSNKGIPMQYLSYFKTEDLLRRLASNYSTVSQFYKLLLIYFCCLRLNFPLNICFLCDYNDIKII